MKTFQCFSSVALCGITATSVACAQIGDSILETEARYGKPEAIVSSVTDQRRIYRQDGFEFDILFVNGKSLRETVHRLGQNNHLSQKECLTWAQTLSGKEGWALQFGNDSAARWVSGDLLASKYRRLEDGADVFSVYGKGFSTYFTLKQRGDINPDSTNATPGANK